MLFLHSSNHLENLSQQFAELLTQPLEDVFATEQIVVQNAGMGRWLSLQTAQQLGISANVNYLFPAEYMWELLRKVVDDVPLHDPSKPDVLRWRLLTLFLDKKEDYPELDHYLTDELAAWDLASTLAPVMDQYLFYRPEWTTQWEKGEFKANDWQARLWQRIIMNETNDQRQIMHWGALQEGFIQSFDKKYQQHHGTNFPQRVSFFNVPALSSGYLNLLAQLSTKIDVHLFIINPCREYWGDIESRKRQSKRPVDERLSSIVGNSLLAALGQQGGDFIDQLLELPVVQSNEEQWVEPQTDSVLHCVQSDILNLYDADNRPDHNECEEQQSLQIHSCHTPLREVEVLHDQILAALDASDDLSPTDIVVMTPEIEIYAPYIDAVFSNKKYNLPFSIADRISITNKPEVEAFLKLLALPEQRFNVEAVFELLEYESIRLRFGLDEKHVLQCRHWVQATNIRWGVSDTMRAESGLPKTYEHSWKYGLDRMLLGYMMPSEQLFEHSNLLPFNEIEGSDVKVLSAFKQFTDTLFQLWDWTSETLIIDEWIEKFQSLLKAIFPDDEKSPNIINQAGCQLIYTILDSLRQQQRLAEFDHTLSFNIIKNVLSQLLESSGEERFISRGITFCALVPMRSVPFKMVALLGMNDGHFPRQDQHHSFDKMANNYKKGDRSRRNEDRYLFLESLLAARERFYLSFIGQSVLDNSPLPPSVIVSDLLDYLTKLTTFDAESWVHQHPLQAFSLRYYDQADALFSYVEDYKILHEKIIPSKQTLAPAFIHKKLPPPDDTFKTLNLEQLTHFYKAPARRFLQQRLGLQTYNETTVLPIREPFALESFVNTRIRQQVATSLSSKQTHHANLISRAKGLLPHGIIGDQAFKKEAHIVHRFFKEYPNLQQLKTQHQRFSLTFDDFTLSGKLTHLTETEGCIKYHLGSHYAGDLLAIWLHHLVLNVVNQNKKKQIITTVLQPDNVFTLGEVEDAKTLLQQLLIGYWSGLQTPLRFFPKSAYKLYADGTGKANPKKALDAWLNNHQYQSESEKFENKLLFSETSTTPKIDIINDDEFRTFAEMTFGRLFDLSETLTKN
ncbi:MAG: exodeoxyribonuclease V subunit gamma [Cocleimonas sp.]|nr:exodeoxyribonuclease V subunit gamma [Cocleimonas sp.]